MIPAVSERVAFLGLGIMGSRMAANLAGAGFELTGSEEHHSFGHDLVGQDWRLPLGR